MPVDPAAFSGSSFDATNRELVALTAAAVTKTFPLISADERLEVRATNVKVDTSKHDPNDLNAWQEARERGKSITAPVTADLQLYRDGKRVQSRANAKIGELPLMGATGTFMVNGNDWFTPFAQFRLKPGIYSRQKTNGEYEAFMPMQGASMTVWMDPAKGQFKLSHGSTNVDLYPVLRALGKTDDQIIQAWGGDKRARELLEQNKSDHSEKDIDKLFQSVFHLKQNRDLLKGGIIKLDENLTGVDHAGKVTALKQWMDSKSLDPYVTKKTVGKAVEKPDDTAFLLASKKILDVQRGDVDPDVRDSPHFKTAHSVADLMAERIERQTWRLKNKLIQKLRKSDDITLSEAMGSHFLDPLTVGYFGGGGGIEGGLAHTAEGANPLALASERTKTTFMGPGGIMDMHAVTKESRLFQPGSLGFIDPIHSPEGAAVGLNVHAAAKARKVGKTLAAPFVPVINGRAKWDQRIPLTIEEANDTTIGYPEFWDAKTGEPVDPYTGDKHPSTVRANKDNEILEVAPGDVKYILPSGQAAFDFVGNSAGFLANTHPNRGMMAGKHITQALPLVHRELPLANLVSPSGGDILEGLGRSSTVHATVAGTVTKIDKTGIWVDGVKHAMFDRYPMQAKVVIDHTPTVKVGDKVKKGDLLADSNYTKDGKIALGVNLRSAYIPWKNASNYEDAIVISQSAAEKLTSDHTHRHELELDDETKVDPKLFISQFPAILTREMVGKLGTDGVIQVGQEVRPGDVLIAAVRARKYDEFDRSAKNLSSIHKMLERPWVDASVKWDEDFLGEITRVVRMDKKIEVHVKTAEAMRIGDKLSMASAAKGTIADILPDHEMPTDEKGRPMEVIFNPHGVAGRINPSQTIEQAVGKLVRDHGVKFDHVNFGDNKVAERVQGLLDEHKVKHEERLFDPVEGRYIENPVPTGYNYVYKLDHPVRKKFSARTRDGYTMDEAPTSGKGKGGQSFDQLTTYALLGHNANAILAESFGTRGTKNDDYWLAYQAGEVPPPPKVPFVFEKFRAMLTAAGIDSQQHGTALHFMPMTDANTLKRSNGEILKASLVRAKDLAEEKGGLFDIATTGGLKGDKWGHIDLGRKIPHPLYEKVIKDLLDLKTADYLGLIGKTRHYNPESGEFSDQPSAKTSTGEDGFRKLFDFDPKERYKEVQEKARTASGSDLNRLNRAARYLKGLQDSKQKPFDAYMVSKIPVIPPQYRPVIEQRNGGLRVADANLLYRDVLLTKDVLQKSEAEGSLASEDLAKARVSLYDAFGALVGVGKSLTHRRDADLRGFVDIIKGKNNKEGLFQQQLARRRNDYTGRSTIEPDATLGPDEIAIPEEMAWKIYQPAIVRRMAQLGWKPADALKEVEKKGLVARNALDEELRTRPVLYNRAPSLHRWSVIAAMPKLTAGKEIKISPFVEGALNSDHDGNCCSGRSMLTVMFNDVVSWDHLKEKYAMRASATTEIYIQLPSAAVVRIPIKDVPFIPSSGKLDKNGASVYRVPSGLSVLTAAPDGRGMRFSPVTGFTAETGCSLVRVETNRGKAVEVSDNESLAVYDQYTATLIKLAPAESLGRLVPVCRSLALPHDTHQVDEFDLGWMFGAFCGDGFHMGDSKHVGFSKLSAPVRQRFDTLYQKFAGAHHVGEYRQRAGVSKLADSAKVHFTDADSTFRDCYVPVAESLFSIEDRACLRKRLPLILNASESYRFGLLSGLLDTDGSVCFVRAAAKNKDQCMIQFSTSSPYLRDGIVQLALSLGIRCSWSTTQPSEERLQTHESYTLPMCNADVQRSAHRLHLYEVEKAEALKRLRTTELRESTDIVPLPAWVVDITRDKKNFTDHALLSTMRTIRSKSAFPSVSRAVALRLLQQPGVAAHPLAAQLGVVAADITVGWERVASVTPIPTEMVYDLEVPETKVFAVNDGLIIYDTVSVFAPLTDKGKREALDLLPSRNLFYDKDRSLAFAVDKDVITGLFALTRRGIGSGKSYPNRAAAIAAYQNNKDGLRMDSLVMVDDEKSQGQQAVGWLIFEGIVPARFLGGISAPIDGKKLSTILDRIATDSPADFNNLGRKLQSAGFAFAARAGGIGGTVQELAIDRTKINALLNQIDKSVKQGNTLVEKRKLALETYAKVKPEIDAIVADHLDNINLGGSVFLAAKPSSKLGMDSYRQMVASPVMVNDARDRAIPSVIKSSYGGGMLLSDYIMATPGARSGMVDKGLSVAGPGFLTKELAGNLGPVRVGEKDCGTHEGIQVPVDPPAGVKQHDADLLDRHLLNDVPGTSFRRNDVVTPAMLSALRDKRVSSLMVRSPMTCQASSPPCQMCAGRTPDGKLHPIGANIGYNYGLTIGERSTQTILKKFHSGGTVGSGPDLADGFARLRELLSVPDTVKFQGTLADAAGNVTSIKSAPQGGHYVQIRPEGQAKSNLSTIEHYVLPGRNIAVVQGEKVERGDRLSDGSFRPQEIAEKKNLLAAQTYVVDEMRKAFQSAGAIVRKPVLEVAVAAMMRFVKVTADGGEHDLVVGDVLPEQEFKKRQLKNPKLQGLPELPGLSHVPLVRSNDMLERLNFQRLEDTLREIPAAGGVSDLSGSKSPIPGFAYGAAFRPGQASFELTKDRIPAGDSAFNRLAHFT